MSLLRWIGLTLVSLLFFRIATSLLHPAVEVAVVVVGGAFGVLAVVGRFANPGSSVARLAKTVSRPAVLLVVATAVMGGFWSIRVDLTRSAKAAEICSNARAAASAAVIKNDYSSARTALNTARDTCPFCKPESPCPEIADAIEDVNKKESAFERIQDEAMAAAAAAHQKAVVDAFPVSSKQVNDFLRTASNEADQGKWALADTDLTRANAALEDFRGIANIASIADTKRFQQLDAMLAAQRKRVDPQLQRLAKAAENASAEKELKSSSVSVSSSQLFNDYEANEVSADDKYKGKKLLVTGSVVSIDKGPLGGIHLQLSTPNEFMATMCSMEDSEKSQAAHLSKGDTVRVLCTGEGMTLGSPSLSDCTLK